MVFKGSKPLNPSAGFFIWVCRKVTVWNILFHLKLIKTSILLYVENLDRHTISKEIRRFFQTSAMTYKDRNRRKHWLRIVRLKSKNYWDNSASFIIYQFLQYFEFSEWIKLQWKCRGSWKDPSILINDARGIKYTDSCS